MKKILVLAIASFCLTAVQAQTGNETYNKQLADSLGADDYGMKPYVLVILKSGANAKPAKKVWDSLLHGHLNNIKRLATEGKLVVAGPLQANPQKYEGLCILNANTVAGAKEMLNTDPLIKAGLLKTEAFSWYGSAALPMYMPYHAKVQKKSF